MSGFLRHLLFAFVLALSLPTPCIQQEGTSVFPSPIIMFFLPFIYLVIFLYLLLIQWLSAASTQIYGGGSIFTQPYMDYFTESFQVRPCYAV
jgi:hypothetical protein